MVEGWKVSYTLTIARNSKKVKIFWRIIMRIAYEKENQTTFYLQNVYKKVKQIEIDFNKKYIKVEDIDGFSYITKIDTAVITELKK